MFTLTRENMIWRSLTITKPFNLIPNLLMLTTAGVILTRLKEILQKPYQTLKKLPTYTNNKEMKHGIKDLYVNSKNYEDLNDIIRTYAKALYIVP